MHTMTDCVHLSCLYIWYNRHMVHTCYDRHLTPDCISEWLILFKLFITCYPSTCNMPIDILVYSIIYTLLFCWYYFPTSIFVYSCIIICSHVICTCTILSFFLHTHWEFWHPGFAHLGLCIVILLIKYLRGSYALRGVWCLLCLTPGYSSCPFLFPVIFLNSMHWTQYLFCSFIHLLSLC